MKQDEGQSGEVAQWQRTGFALYVHWPFCQSKCPYCDFNSHVATSIDQERWLKAYKSEIQRLSSETRGRVLRSIFFGGGTPSLMAPFVVEGIVDEAARTWNFANDIEITLEANPTSVEAHKFRNFRVAGINRVSVGVQALDDAALRKLGRLHSASEAISAIATAQAIFERSSIDLIYARQDQSLTEWEDELRRALGMSTDHISLYQLTVEPETIFGARHRHGKLRGLPSEDLAADMYIATQAMCDMAGLPAYEVSNHARPGSESRHNMVYWSGGDYLGVGPGAHGRITAATGNRYATVCHSQPGLWLQNVEIKGTGELPRARLSAEEQRAEMLLMGLRVSDGIDLTTLCKVSGRRLNAETVADLQQSGHVEIFDRRLRATQSGRMVLNAVIRALDR